MTTPKLPDHLRGRIDQAFAAYLVLDNADYGDLSLEEEIALHKRLRKQQITKRELIQRLAAVWQEWTSRSPRSRMPDEKPPYGEIYPFARWVADLFPLYTENRGPPSRNRIRRMLKLRAGTRLSRQP
jgi:hypothetical protein